MQEWYLIGNKTSPNMIGGYENDGFLDCKDDAFYETLQTDLANTVIVYNYDLSESREIRGIVEGNTSDTQLKSMERSILVPIGTLHSGDYVFFEDEYWIVDGRPGNNKIYEKATLKECQYKLRWQKSDGTIIERFANLTSSSKYDVGENGNNTIILSSNNYLIIMPNDKDSMTIEGKRVFIDLSDVPEKVFKITRNDDVLFNHHGHGGTLNLIADKVELNKDKDNQELGICNYIPVSSPTPPTSNPNETADLSAEITFKGTQELKIGGNTKTLTGYFIDKDGNTTSDIGEWEVVTIDELMPYIKPTITDNVLKIKVLENDFATRGKVRITFSNSDKSVSKYLDFNITTIF